MTALTVRDFADAHRCLLAVETAQRARKKPLAEVVELRRVWDAAFTAWAAEHDGQVTS